MTILTRAIDTDKWGGFVTPATGHVAGSADFAFVAAPAADTVISNWRADLEGSEGRCDGIDKTFCTLDLSIQGANAHDCYATVLGLRSPLTGAALTYADYAAVGTVVVPLTRLARASALKAVGQMTWFHIFPCYVTVLSSTAVAGGVGGNIRTRFIMHNSGDRAK